MLLLTTTHVHLANALSLAPPPKLTKEEAQLVKAAQYGDAIKVIELVERGVNLEVPGNRTWSRPLMIAAGAGRINVVKVLLDAGAKIDAHDGPSRTALFHAVEGGYLNVAKLLLDAGADINTKDHQGGTLLTIAAFYNHTELALFFIDAGLDVNIKVYGNAYTALHSASYLGDIKVVKALLDAGADANPTIGDYALHPPIMNAVIEGHSAVVKLLLDAGADLSLKDDKGRTPLDLAKENKNTEIIEMLKAAMKKGK